MSTNAATPSPRSFQPARPPRPASVDGFLPPRAASPRRSLPPPKPQPIVQPTLVRATAVPSAPSHSTPVSSANLKPPSQGKPGHGGFKQHLLSALRTLGQAVLLLTLFVLGFFVQSQIVGQALIGIYALCALVFRLESRLTFLLAVLSLGVVLAASLRTDRTLANAFAVYAFLLLVVGTVSLAREVRDAY